MRFRHSASSYPLMYWKHPSLPKIKKKPSRLRHRDTLCDRIVKHPFAIRSLRNKMLVNLQTYISSLYTYIRIFVNYNLIRKYIHVRQKSNDSLPHLLIRVGWCSFSLPTSTFLDILVCNKHLILHYRTNEF